MKECIRPIHPCPYRIFQDGQSACNILGKNDYFCIDEEEYMDAALENQEKLKRRGIKEVRRIESHIKDLSDFVETCASADVLDRIMDATKELRKARIKLIERYDIDIEDLVKGEQ
jgi:hypothetical protein